MYYIDVELDNDGVRHQKYLYNGDDERVIVITDGSLTGFLYDNGILIAEYDNGGSVSAQYIHGLGLGHDVGSLICKQTAEDTQYSFYNYRGDVIDTLIGATITSYRYDAFGNLIDSSAPEFGFSSKRYDASTDLSYFGARYYDASLGRFISRDPLGYIDGPNMYVYVRNNPIFWLDLFGEAVYKVNRGMKAFRDDPRQPQEQDNIYSHTYIAITDDQGNVIHTLSFGNEMVVNSTIDKESGWFLDKENDLIAAQRAIDRGLAEKVQFQANNDISTRDAQILNENLDLNVSLEFIDRLKQPENHESDHYNIGLNNCKQQTHRLLYDASMKTLNDYNATKRGCSK